MQSNFNALSIFYGLLTVLPLGLLVLWLMSKLEHRRTPKWNYSAETRNFASSFSEGAQAILPVCELSSHFR